MNDLSKLREEFEKFPVIAHGIKHRQFYFDDQDDCYTPTSSSHYHDAVYANGALDAYQEQQAKIDALKAKLEKLESGYYVLVPKEPSQVMLDVFPEIEYVDTYAGNCSLWASDEDIKNGYKAMIEAAQEQDDV